MAEPADRQNEPVLNVKNIQGNIIPGFNKDFQALLFLQIENERNFRNWLRELVPYVTTMEQVLTFRSLLTGEERRGNPPKVKTTWINIAFSHAALIKLGEVKCNEFTDVAFKEGLTKARANKELGDPKSKDGEDELKNFVRVLDKDEEAEIIMIVASDDRLDLFNAVARIGKTINEPSSQSGVRVICTQYGANLPGRREHFGFRDGISQPGVRGQIPDNYGGYLTPSYEGENQGSPGLDLVWPGEFVFGYRNQKGGFNVVPDWAKDGSFLVFRRLKQNVGAFHKFLRETALNPALLAAKCIGRWPSGTPILDDTTGENEEAAIARGSSINNDFTFTEDSQGATCPFAAHIRRVYPRDGDQTHRLLRRGIPYGEPSFSSPTAPYSDGVDRGLLFLAYQTSIVNQFEYLQKQANTPRDNKGNEVGFDPIIGQNTKQETRERQFRVAYMGTNEREQSTASIKEDWVTPTGGGYFFAPSIDTLQMFVVAKSENPKPDSSTRSSVAPKESPAPIEAAQVKTIKPEDWARIWAHAWAEEKEGRPAFRKILKTNPAKAVEVLKEQADWNFLKLDDDQKYKKFIDLAGDIYKRPFNRGSFEGISFNRMSPHDLKEIAEKGTLHSQPFCIQPAEWVIRRKQN
jgi:Dyp-type peroxidase family